MKCLKCFRPRCGYPPLELLVQPLDRIGGAYAAPLARRQPGEGEQAVAGFLQAVGNGAVFEAPLADEGLATDRDLLGRRRVDHVVVIRRDLFVQPLGAWANRFLCLWTVQR